MTAIKYMHHTPGRLRLKGEHFHCHGERARQAVAALRAMKGVEGVQLNAHAGSLTIHYDHDETNQATLLAALEQAGCLHAASVPKVSGEGVTGVFGKALVGALAQRTATKLIGALL